MGKIILLLSIVAFGEVNACLNGESLILKNSIFVYEDFEGYVPSGHNFDSDESFRSGIKELDSLYKLNNDLDYLSDKGVLLILLKEYNEAIKLYLRIEKMAPNRYSTASNIGTAYELIGQNENALKWIRKSVEIDSTSHNNSEWIHVKILEAKMKGDDFVTSTFLLNTDFGNEVMPVSKLSPEELRKLRDALFYQLNERISFVKPEDKIVAQLLFDLGNVSFLMKLHSDASEDYKKAKEFGLKNNLVDARINKISIKPAVVAKKILSTQTNTQISNKAYFLIGAALLLLGISAVIFVVIKISRK